MKCYVVRDLLSEYEEKLCSPETKKDIEEHLAGCEACRQLYEDLKEAQDEAAGEDTQANMENIRPFARIHYRIRRLTIRGVIIGIVLLAICLVFGILTFFQFYPELGGISYDTIKYYQKAKAVTESFAKGDMEAFLQGMLYGLDAGGQLNMSIYTHTSEFYEDTLAELNELYNETLAGKDVRVRVEDVRYYTGDISCFYNGEEGTNGCGYKAWTKILVENMYIGMYIYMYNDDGYGVYMTIADNDEDYTDSEFFTYTEHPLEGGEVTYDVVYNYDNAFLSAITQCADRVNFFQNVINFGDNSSWVLGLGDLWNRKENETIAYNFISKSFAEDCSVFDPDAVYAEKLVERISALMPLVTVNESRMTNTGYDPETKKLTAVLFWSFTDQEGHTGILQKNFYYGPYGYEAADDTEILLCEEGMDGELQQQVKELFD